MLMMSRTVTYVIDLRDSRVDIDTRGAFRPHLMKNGYPQNALVMAVGHMRPEAQGKIGDNIIRSRIISESGSQMVDDISIDPA